MAMESNKKKKTNQRVVDQVNIHASNISAEKPSHLEVQILDHTCRVRGRYQHLIPQPSPYKQSSKSGYLKATVTLADKQNISGRRLEYEPAISQIAILHKNVIVNLVILL